MKGNKFIELNENIYKSIKLITKTTYKNIFRNTYNKKEYKSKQI